MTVGVHRGLAEASWAGVHAGTLAQRVGREPGPWRHIGAVYHDGVLTIPITVPVAAQVKPRKVQITLVGSVAQAVEAAMTTTG